MINLNFQVLFFIYLQHHPLISSHKPRFTQYRSLLCFTKLNYNFLYELIFFGGIWDFSSSLPSKSPPNNLIWKKMTPKWSPKPLEIPTNFFPYRNNLKINSSTQKRNFPLFSHQKQSSLIYHQYQSVTKAETEEDERKRKWTRKNTKNPL